MDNNRKKWIRIGIIGAAAVLTIVCYLSGRTGSDLFQTESSVFPQETTENEQSLKSEKEKHKIVVDICGAVENPSVLILDEGSRVYEAVDAAGGLKEGADIRTTNLAAELNDGMKLYIPTKVEVSMEEKITKQMAGSAYIGGNTAITSSETVSNNGSLLEESGEKININTADEETLQTLKGIGPSTAKKIVEYRTQYGRFKKIEDVMNVSGIGQKTFNKWKDLICIE